MSSAYIQSLKDEAKNKIANLEKIREVTSKCWSIPDEALPPEKMMNTIGSPDGSHFRSAMAHIFQELSLRGKVTPSSSILDIGSGCGRIAIPFSLFLENGNYVGVDVWGEGVEWCNSNIKGISSNFKFITVKSNNNYYFGDRDRNIRNSYEMPFIASNSIDFSFAISVFTHLVLDDCRSYLSELSRVLKKGGCAYVTCFIIDDFFFDFVRRTGLHASVKQEEPGSYYAYHGQDFFAGYTMRAWTQMLEDCGLRIVASDVGTWAEKPGAINYQDTFLVVPSCYQGGN